MAGLPANQSMAVAPDRPVMVIAVPQNSVVNVTFEQQAPQAVRKELISNSTVLSEDVSRNGSIPPTVNATMIAIFENASLFTASKPDVIKRVSTQVQGFVAANLLPLGSEGPNAFRDSPINAVLPAGVVLDKAMAQSAASGSGSSSPRDPSKTPFTMKNRRAEIKFMDFQMNHTDSAQEINQPIIISVKYIV